MSCGRKIFSVCALSVSTLRRCWKAGGRTVEVLMFGLVGTRDLERMEYSTRTNEE